MMEALVYKLSWRGSKTTRSTSNGTRQTSCFNCEPIWLEKSARFCGVLETVDGGPNRRSAQGLVRQREPSRTVRAELRSQKQTKGEPLQKSLKMSVG